MSYPCPVTISAATADVAALGAASVQFALAMDASELYLFASSGACWIKQGANPTASAAAGSLFVPANVVVTIDGALGAKLAVIQDGAATGKASLALARVVR